LKRFIEYGGFQGSTEAGSFSLSQKVMPSGNVRSYLEATKETFSELAETLSEENNEKNKLEAKLLMSVKIIMTMALLSGLMKMTLLLWNLESLHIQ
jgi:hypothetical protein